jgi:hypothetical protein
MPIGNDNHKIMHLRHISRVILFLVRASLQGPCLVHKWIECDRTRRPGVDVAGNRTSTDPVRRLSLSTARSATAWPAAIVQPDLHPAMPDRIGRRGHPRMTLPTGALIAQLVKRYAHHRVVDIERNVMHGAEAAVAAVLRRTQGAATAVINTAYLERLDATFCTRLASLTRRTRAGVHQKDTLDAGMWLVGIACPFVKLAPGVSGGARRTVA